MKIHSNSLLAFVQLLMPWRARHWFESEQIQQPLRLVFSATTLTTNLPDRRVAQTLTRKIARTAFQRAIRFAIGLLASLRAQHVDCVFFVGVTRDLRTQGRRGQADYGLNSVLHFDPHRITVAPGRQLRPATTV